MAGFNSRGATTHAAAPAPAASRPAAGPVPASNGTYNKRGFTGQSGGSATSAGSTGTSPGSTSSSTGSAADQDAMAVLKAELDSWGLGALADEAWGWITQGQGLDQIIYEVRQTPEYKQSIYGQTNAARQAAGLPAMTESQIAAYQDTATQLMRSSGLPKGFYDTPADLAKLMAADVSPAELQQRIVNGYQAAMDAPEDVRAQLQNYFGISSGNLAAYYLDPTVALPVLQRQLTTAQIGAQATRTGFGPIGESTAEQLTREGVTDSQAQTGFSDLAKFQQLFNPLPGQSGAVVGQDVQLGAEFEHDAADQALITNIQDQRKAPFGGGGAFGSTSTGLAGTGQAKAA